MDGYYDDHHPLVALRCPLVLVGVATAPARRLGHWLAATEGLPFIDLDRRVEHAAGQSLWALVAEHGEDRYRALERDALAAALRSTPVGVIVGGDGLVLAPANRALLNAQTRWIGLTAGTATVTRLLQQSALVSTGFWHPTQREVLMVPTQITAYYEARVKALRHADTVIDLDQETPRTRRTRVRAQLPLVA